MIRVTNATAQVPVSIQYAADSAARAITIPPSAGPTAAAS